MCCCCMVMVMVMMGVALAARDDASAAEGAVRGCAGAGPGPGPLLASKGHGWRDMRAQGARRGQAAVRAVWAVRAAMGRPLLRCAAAASAAALRAGDAPEPRPRLEPNTTPRRHKEHEEGGATG